MTLLTLVLLTLLAGSAVYCVLIVVSVWNYARSSMRYRFASDETTSISVLKPLAGVEQDLEDNLRSFFEQDYNDFELLFAVREADDPALPVVERLKARYPSIRVRVLITGEPRYANAKVYSLSFMAQAATHDVLVMSDSDIRVSRSFLRDVAREIAMDAYDLASCPYRACGGGDFWSRLEALGMNTEFWAGVFVARYLEGVKFAVGPTVIARRSVLQAVSWESLSRYLAEDFMLGQLSAEAGFRVAISHCSVEHRLHADSMTANLSHRLRWARSTRRSRPAGYVGQVFTYPLAWALLFAGIQHLHFRETIVAAVGARMLSVAVAASRHGVGAKLTIADWALVPVQDLLGFAIWVAGFSGNSVLWRGRKYFLKSDGTFDPVS